MRIDQFGEFVQNVRHLVAALAAADVDDDVHVGPLGQLMLHDRFAGTEGPRNGRGAALGEREQRVDDALTRRKRDLGHVLLLVRPRHAHGPFLSHGELFDRTVRQLYVRDDVVHRKASALNVHELAVHAKRHHDAVLDGRRLLHGSQEIAAFERVTRLGGGHEIPRLFPGQGRHGNAARDRVAGQPADLRQRALDTVVDAFQHARTELHGKRIARRLHDGARAEARSLLVDLDGGGVARHVQDLPDQVLLAHSHHVRDVGVGQAVRHDQRT